MARYTQDSRERVRDAVDFEELVGARTELKRAGVRRLQGLCPFHDERTPSFGIDPVEKLYHCFGCGVGGDVFSFVMETEGLDFAGALESLADRYGVELEREAEDPAAAARRERTDRLLALLERTAAYYVRVLWESPEAAAAREYLAGRGLEEGALREFRVGFSPGAFDRVVGASERAGYRPEELLACGLASRRRDGRGVIDRFRGRIMFPLCDERGRVLGFGARALRPDDQPKYLNSSDNDVFHKGELLYGADLARAAAAKAGRVVLVEGYTDAVALRQAGVAEVVGSMGTALTERQVVGAGAAGSGRPVLPGPRRRRAGGGLAQRDGAARRQPLPGRARRRVQDRPPAGRLRPGRRRAARRRRRPAGTARPGGADRAVRGRAGARAGRDEDRRGPRPGARGRRRRHPAAPAERAPRRARAARRRPARVEREPRGLRARQPAARSVAEIVRRAPGRTAPARRSTAASSPSGPSWRCAWRCRRRARRGSRPRTSTSCSPPRRPAAPPSTSVAACARPRASCRPATSRSPASSPSS